MNVSSIIVDLANANREFRTNDLSEHLSGKIGLSRKTLSGHSRKLLDERKIFRIGKGICTTTPKAIFHPIPSVHSIWLYKKLKTEYPLLDFCVHSGEVLSDLQHRLSYSNNTYMKAERNATEIIFHFVQDMHGYSFLLPKEDIVFDYIRLDRKSSIMRPLVSESPI